MPGMQRTSLPVREVPAAECPLHLPQMRFQGAVKMGKVLAIMRVMPASMDVNLRDLTAELRSRVPQIRDMAEEPIAFGLKAIKLAVVVGDEEGGTDAIEGTIASVKGVASVDIIDLDRLL